MLVVDMRPMHVPYGSRINISDIIPIAHLQASGGQGVVRMWKGHQGEPSINCIYYT